MKVAAAQISCSLGDPKANLLKVQDFSRRAKDAGVELIVFPEMTDTGYSMSLIQDHASSWNNGFVPGLQEIAANLSIAIVCGVSEKDGASVYNSLIFVNRQGQIAAKYRKTHLYAVAPVEEQKCFASGDTFGSFGLGDLRFGFSICYDLRFPENQSYVIASNRVGKDEGLWFCGSSAIIDPRGVAIASASADREELVEADVSQELVLSVRSRVKSLAHRRQDLYE
jgi:omega-amidase